MKHTKQGKPGQDWKKEIVKSSSNMFVVTFDLQSVLYTPCTVVSLTYYMRKLCCYNLSVYNLSNQSGTCYEWSEVEARRGSCEVSACLHIQPQSLLLNIKHVVLYSDACGGKTETKLLQPFLIQLFQLWIVSLSLIINSSKVGIHTWNKTLCFQPLNSLRRKHQYMCQLRGTQLCTWPDARIHILWFLYSMAISLTSNKQEIRIKG